MTQQQGMPVTPAELLQMIGEQAVEIRVLRNQVQELAGRLREGVESGTMNDE